MRRLTLEEADTVNESSRGDGDRPTYFNSRTGADEEISASFEAYLILTPISTRSSVSGFLQTILDNDPNQVDVRDQLLTEFFEEEKRNELEGQRMYEQLTEYYDQVRTSFAASLEGFEDVTEATLLQESLTRSMGSIVASRDRHTYNYSALSVLASRHEESGAGSQEQENRSWVRVLVEYD